MTSAFFMKKFFIKYHLMIAKEGGLCSAHFFKPHLWQWLWEGEIDARSDSKNSLLAVQLTSELV